MTVWQIMEYQFEIKSSMIYSVSWLTRDSWLVIYFIQRPLETFASFSFIKDTMPIIDENYKQLLFFCLHIIRIIFYDESANYCFVSMSN